MTDELHREPEPFAFRLPGSIRLGPVALQIAELTRSLDYYERVLGLEVLERVDRPVPTARLGALGSERVLVELRERPGAQPVPRRGRLGLYHFALLVPSRADLGRFLRHLNDDGVRAGAADHAVSEALYLTDPDGITIEVYRDRPRSEWVFRNGEIIGGSDPLDTAGVLAAGEGEWYGMSPDTLIGHVHFYVDDLEAAAAFYERGLGFARVPWKIPGALFLAAGGYHHHVGLNTWAAGSPLATDEDAKLLSWDLILPDRGALQRTVDSLTRGGIPVTGGSEGFVASDPWHLTVRVRTG